MNRQLQITRECSHFNGKHAFGDQVAGSDADDAHAQHSLRLGIENELGHPLGTIKRDGASGSTPGKFGDGDFAAVLLGLGFRQAGPGDFRIGEHNRRNRVRFEGDLAADDGFDGGPALVHGFVGEHGFADHVADRVDGRIVGLELLVDLDEALRADLDFCFFQAGNFGVRLAADRDQNFFENFLALLHVGSVESGSNAAAFFFQRFHRRVEQNSVERLLQTLVQRQHQVTIRARQQSGEHFDHSHLRAEGRIHRPQLESDVAAADHEQGLRDVLQVERAGRVHHARAVDFEGWNHGRARPGRQQNAIEAQRLATALRFRDAQSVGILKAGAALDVFHRALLRKLAEAAGQTLDHAFFPGAQLGEIDFRIAEFNAPVFCLVRFFDQLGYMQQRLGRNAAAVQAYPAGIHFRIDEGNFQAKIGREKSGGVTARSAAHNCELQVGIVCHEFFESLKLTLNRQQEWLFKRFGNPAQEARRIGPIDQPMIIRKR